ncbi:MAG: rhodanese-like domain-containing protein [Anaerolineae bacterium]
MNKMKRTIYSLLAVLTVVTTAAVGCRPTPPPPPTATPVPPTATAVPPTPTPLPPTETPTPEVDEVALLANYITEKFANWNPVITADVLYDNLTDGDTSNDPFILSVRKPEDYAKGHIQGAYNIFWKDIVKEEYLSKLPKDRQIVVYCYTGHTGEAAATLLLLLGYNVTNLKFGFMGWTLNDEALAQPRFTGPAGYPVETEPHPLTETYGLPTWKTGKTDPAAIVLARAQEVVPNWNPVITADVLYDNLTDGDTSNDPFILSVRKPEDYAKGHIQGAYNIFWKDVAKPENLAYYPTDRPIMTYCYTGHTGQAASVALALLGYNAINLKYGMMGWTDSDEVLAQPRYDAATAPDYPIETEPHPLP